MVPLFALIRGDGTRSVVDYPLLRSALDCVPQVAVLRRQRQVQLAVAGHPVQCLHRTALLRLACVGRRKALIKEDHQVILTAVVIREDHLEAPQSKAQEEKGTSVIFFQTASGVLGQLCRTEQI